MLASHRLVRKGFTLDRRSSTLLADGRTRILSARALAILWRLAEADGEQVDRETLFRLAWPGQKVADGSLRQAIWEIRQALGEGLADHLESVRGSGYRLVSEPMEWTQESHALVGRVRERLLLSEALEEAIEGRGRTRLLSGPAGVGKSALASAMLKQAVKRGVRILAPGGARGPGAPPLWPFITLLSELPAQALAPTQHVKRLQRVLTDPQPESGWTERAAEQRFLLFEELARVFVRLAERQPIALFLDDLHEADATTLSFIERFAREVGPQRILLLLAARQVPRREHRELARTREQLLAMDAEAEIVVGDLDIAELGELLAAEVGGAPSTAWVASVHALTRGNPLFSLQVARHYGAATGPDASTAVEELIARRLHALPEPVRRALLASAVWGESFSLHELVGVLGCSEEEGACALEHARERGLLSFSAGRTQLDFAHPLMRRAALRLSGPAELAELHLRAARWLDARGAVYARARAHAIAHHASAAMPYGGAELTARHALVAAEDAYAATAFADAARLYALAIEAMDHCPNRDEATRVRAQLALGDAMRAADVDEASVRAVFLQAARASELLGEHELRAEAALGFAGQRTTGFTPGVFALVRDDELIALLEQAIDAMGLRATKQRALLLAALAYALTATTQRQRRERASADSVRAAREVGDEGLIARVLYMRVLTQPVATMLAEQQRTCDELVAITTRLGVPRAELEARTQRILLSISAADPAGVERDLPRIRDLASTLGVPEAESRAELWQLLRAFWDGQLDLALSLTQRSFEHGYDRVTRQALYAVRAASLAFLRFGAGAEVRESATSANETYPATYARYALLANVHAHLGERDRARELFDLAASDDFAAQPDSVMWLTELTALAQVATRLGDAQRAALVYQRLLPYRDRVAICGGEGVVVGPVAGFLGMLCATLNRFAEAEALFARAREIVTSFGMSLMTQLGDFEEAMAMLQRGTPEDRRRARRTIAQLRAFAAERGVPCLAQRAELLAVRCREARSDETLTFSERSDC